MASERWTNAVDNAALGVDALIIADIAVLEYAANKYPDLELHLSVQASATNAAAIDFYHKNFNVKRVCRAYCRFIRSNSFLM